MKYKVGDIIYFKQMYDSESIILDIMIYTHKKPQYKFRFLDNDDTHIITYDYIENQTELNIKFMRKQKLYKLHEI